MKIEDYHIDELIDIRKEAREKKDYVLSDEIRVFLDSKFIFTFDTKHGQEVYYLHKRYFANKDRFSETCGMTNRLYVEYKIKQDIHAEKLFDAWLYSTKQKSDFLALGRQS